MKEVVEGGRKELIMWQLCVGFLFYRYEKSSYWKRMRRDWRNWMCTLMCMSFHLRLHVWVCFCFWLTWIQANQCRFVCHWVGFEQACGGRGDGGDWRWWNWVLSHAPYNPSPLLHKYQQLHHHDISIIIIFITMIIVSTTSTIIIIFTNMMKPSFSPTLPTPPSSPWGR